MTDNIGLGFIDAPCDRASQQRGDKDWLAERLVASASKFVVFFGERPVISIANDTLGIDFWTIQSVKKLIGGFEPILLHLDDHNNAVFVVQFDEQLFDKVINNTTKLIDLRSLAVQGLLPAKDLGALAQAKSLLSWHGSHPFCAKCGEKTILADAGYRRDCQHCSSQHFPRVDPVVIMLIKHGDKFLMGRGHNFDDNHFSALAGFLEPGETIEAATRRETFEETGIVVGSVRYLLSQPWPFPSTLMIGVVGQALTTKICLDENELAEARWFSLSEVRQMIDGKHPNGTSLPPAMSIAYQMLQEYLLSES